MPNSQLFLSLFLPGTQPQPNTNETSDATISGATRGANEAATGGTNEATGGANKATGGANEGGNEAKTR